MRGFTLLEIAIVLLLLSLVVAFGISFLSFNKDFFYLRDEAKKFSFALNTVSDLSQRVLSRNTGEYFCAYGIYFPSSTSYEVLAFSTSTKLCEYIFSSSTLINNFINSNLQNKKYIHQNEQISNVIIPQLSLNTNLSKAAYFSFSISSKNCSSTIQPPILFLYVYSYIDLFFMYQQAGNNWEKINSDKIYICLSKGNERYTIKVNKLGQINFER